MRRTRARVAAGGRVASKVIDPAASAGATESLAAVVHPYCVACSSANARSLGLRYVRTGPQAVEATFDCGRDLEGYPCVVHGGIVALIVDSAMTNCLFACGHIAMTAELTIRYHAPIRTGYTAIVRAMIKESTTRLHIVEGTITQEDESKVTATGKFLTGGQ
ncbi:MAG: PaaI family thioesterase [Candidatus Zixiibacteriota bacterium]